MTEQGPTVFGGRYELHRRIARGGMADVFLARDQLLDRSVAVKVLFPEFAADPLFVERFRREAKAAAGLSHPNIVGIFDWGEENGTYYIVMEYVEGASLAQTIHERGPLDPGRAADIASEVAAALGHAHDRDVAHRDVKPGNVLISNKGEVKVADFGIATALVGGVEQNLTQTGSVMGTATYFSPEQAQGKPVDARSDLYSLGVVMYEMLVGNPPFSGDTPVAISYQHVQEAPPSPLEDNPAIPRPLAAITMKLLAKDPINRYPNAVDLRADIGRFRSGAQLGPEMTTPPGGAPNAPRPVAIDGTNTFPEYVSPFPQGDLDPRHAVPPATVPPMGTQMMPVAGTQMMPAMGNDVLAQHGYGPTYAEPPRRQGPGFGAIAFLLVLLGLVGVVVVLISLYAGQNGDDPNTDQIATPTISLKSVRGLEQGAAVREIESQGLVPKIVLQASDEVAEGLVISQDPRPAQLLSEGDEVTIVVSSGLEPEEIPIVVGIQGGDAERELRQLGFEVEVVDVESDDDLPGQVLSQSPAAGEFRPPGTTVTIEVVKGPLSKEIPDVKNLSEDDAKELLIEEGYEVKITRQNDDKVKEGFAIETVPAAGVLAKPEDVIDLVISEGPAFVRVPPLEGLTRNTAIEELTAAGFAFIEGTTDTTDPSDEGIVLLQSPVAGTEILEGDPVTFFLGLLIAPTPEPTATAIPPTPTVVVVPTATPIPEQPTATPVPTVEPTATIVPASG